MTIKQLLNFTASIINSSIEIMEPLLDTKEFEEYCDHVQSMIAQIEWQIKNIKDE